VGFEDGKLKISYHDETVEPSSSETRSRSSR